MRKKERVIEAVARLEKLYPDAICSLEYKDAFQLLIVLVSAENVILPS